MDKWGKTQSTLEEFAKSFDRSARLRPKRSKLWGLTGPLSTFATTIGRTVYIPADWTSYQVLSVIPHEVGGHVKQFRWCGLGIHPNAGILGMIIVYLWGIFFPIGLAYGRYRCELHAEIVSWRYHLKRGIMSTLEVKRRADWFGSLVVGSAYLYAWPRSLGLRGFQKAAQKVISEHQ